MKLITNENIPFSSVKILEKEGFDVISVGVDFKGYLDEQVMEVAIQQNRIIITFDSDYGELIFKKGYRPPAGVIYLRWGVFKPEEPGLYLIDMLRSGNLNFENKLTVVSENTIRQRKY